MLFRSVGLVNGRTDYLLAASWEHPLLPYGVLLFALSGLPAVSEMVMIAKGDKQIVRRSILWGSGIATVLTLLFGVAVAGVSGLGTSQDAVTSFAAVIGPAALPVLALFGLFAVATTYFTVGLHVRETFELDFGFNRSTAWLIAAMVPFALYLISNQNFIRVVEFTGAIFTGGTAVIVAALYVNVKNKRRIPAREALPIATVWAYLVVAVLVTGAAYKVGRSIAEAWKV